jgi:MFS family permease
MPSSTGGASPATDDDRQGGPTGAGKRFWRFAASGVFFQGGVASVEANTIVSALVQGLTGSPLAVGISAAITRYGWLFPQIIVAYLAQRRQRRMPYYKFGAFGRAACLAAIALLLLAGAELPSAAVVATFFVLWTLYGFISGIVGVPYNDIVARSIPSSRRSRLLALRFFGGGILALIVAAVAHELLRRYSFFPGYAAILSIGAATLGISALFFASAKEDPAVLPAHVPRSFGSFLGRGLTVLREDRQFRTFLYVQWLAGAVSMALPFYILQVAPGEREVPFVGILLGAQTVGALLSNTLWGWWGDRRGKLSLLRLVSALNAIGPMAILLWMALGSVNSPWSLPWFAALFFVLGAVGNGRAIAYIGYLMEISPQDSRPAYSGYFNALVAPAALFPVLGAGIAVVFGFAAVFALSLVAAVLQSVTLLAISKQTT